MWVFEKIKESMESIPLDLRQYMDKSGEDVILPSKNISDNLYYNIITPDKIPEFCLPPRLYKRSQLQGNEVPPADLCHQNQTQQKSTQCITDTIQEEENDAKTKNPDTALGWKAAKKPLPFSAEVYGLAGMYESPNTRRKESLFLSKCPVYMFDRKTPKSAPRPGNETHLLKKHSPLSGFLPLFSNKRLSDTGSTESETPSSCDSSPVSSPYTSKVSLYLPSNTGQLKGATSCPSLINNVQEKSRGKMVTSSFSYSHTRPQSLEGSLLSLAPPVNSPLDVLQCQERLQREHVLTLMGRGKVRLSAECSTFSNNSFSSLFTIRVRVVSVEGLREETDRRTLNCALCVCLIPGKLQQQNSATIKNCHCPVFNEDFFFTELSQENIMELQLRLKVVDKHLGGSLRRGTVMGTITKPLSHLVPVKIC